MCAVNHSPSAIDKYIHPALCGKHYSMSWQIQKTFKGLITLRKQNKTEIKYLPIRMPNSSPPSFTNALVPVAKTRKQSKGRKTSPVTPLISNTRIDKACHGL